MKKYWFSICFLVICIALACKQEKCYAAENPEQTVEIVLLIDTSKSMCGQRNKLVNWSEDFCISCINKNIILSYVTFDNKNNEKVIIKRTKINKDTYKSCKEKINKVVINGDYTDQLGAFKKAEDILKNSNADIKYIIMLSDGEMDYKNINSEKKERKKNSDNSPEKEMQKRCINFVNENQKIILVGFGKDIQLFKDIINGNKNSNSSLIKYVDSSYNPSDVVNEFFNGIGGSEKVLEESKKDGTLTDKITFKLKNKYDKIDIFIKNLNNTKVDFNKDILVYCKDTKEKNLIFEPGEDYLKIILTNPQKGNYKILLPKSNWYYRISYWYTHVDEVKLKLYNNERELGIASNDNGIACYEPDIFQNDLTLKIELCINDEVKKDEIKIKEIVCLNTKEISDSDMEKLWNNKNKIRKAIQNPDSEWFCGLGNTLDENNNVYQARVFLIDKPYINSNKIKIIPQKEDLVNETLNTIILKENDLGSFVPESYKKYMDKIKVVIGEDVLNNNIENKKYSSTQNGKIVTFKKDGDYIIDMKNSNDDIFAKIEVKVTKKWWYELSNMVKKNIIPIISIFVLIFLICFFIRKLLKKKKEKRGKKKKLESV